MLSTLVTHAATVVPMALNNNGIQTFLLTKIVPIVLAAIGCLIILSANKGNWSKTFSTTGIAIIGIMFIVGAAGFVAFGQELSTTIFGG